MNNANRYLNKKILVLIVALLFVCFLGFYFSGRSRITFVYSGENELQIDLYDQLSDTWEKYTISKNKTIQVKKSNYEVLTANQDGSYLGLIKTKGFLNSSDVEIELIQENDGTFIATNPSNCGYYSTVYVSYDCSSSSETLTSHKKATSENPSYTISNSKNRGIGTISNIMSIKEKRYALVQDNNTLQIGRNSLYEVIADENGDYLNFIKNLNSLNSSIIYKAVPYRDGFIAYNDTLSDVYYYSGIEQEAQYVDSGIAKYFEAYANGYVSVNEDSILFSKNNLDDIQSTESSTVLSRKTIDGSVEASEIVPAITEPVECAKNKICGLSKKTLNVYDFSENNLKKLYEISDVNDFIASSDNIVNMLKNNSLYELNLGSKTGHRVYSYSGFEGYSLLKDKDAVLIHARSSSLSSTIKINSNKTRKSSIFPLLEKLSQSSLVSSYSVYDSTIYVLPNLGDIVYLENEGYFGYPQKAIDDAKTKIDMLVLESGVSAQDYDLIYLL